MFGQPSSDKATLVASMSLSMVLLVSSLAAQVHTGSCLRGEIVDYRGVGDGDLTAELRTLDDRKAAAREPVAADGHFRFNEIEDGDYELSISDVRGHVVHREFVTVRGIGTDLEIRLPQMKGEQPVAGTASVEQLRHKIPPAALKEFRKAVEASQRGEIQASMRHLQKALATEPAYMEAHNNLGAQYMRLQQYDKAIEQLQAAAELDHGAAPVFGNLAVALYAAHRSGEAEQAARQALKLDSRSSKSRFVLGAILAAEQKDDGEALWNLRAAAREIPQARLTAAEVLMRAGNRPAAAAELRKYLESSGGDRRPEAESWLAELERSK